MKLKHITLVAVALMALGVLGGCSESDCEKVCKSYNECEPKDCVGKTDCNVGRIYDVECDEFCADVEEFNDDTKCGTQWEAHVKCWSSNDSKICDVEFEGCVESADAWMACYEPYCAEDAATADDPNCYLAPF